MQKDPLGQLQKHIDESSLKASQVARRFADIVRGDILRLLLELDIAHSAKARKEVEDAIRADIAELEKRLAEIEESAMQFAVQSADNEYIEYKKKEDEELKKAFGGGGSGEKNGKKGQPVKNKKDKNGFVRHSEKRSREIIALASGNGESLAAVYTKNMEHRVIKELRQATLMGILESSVRPMTHKERMKATRKNWEKAVERVGGKAEFVDSAGKTWDSSRYFQMNIRTNAMRVYNDSVADNLTQYGEDLAMITRGGDPHCMLCYPWEGRIISISGNTKGFPSYADARNSGVFHPNCRHTIDAISPYVPRFKKEIELQKGMMPKGFTKEDMEANRAKIDIARKQKEGLSFGEAVRAVDRDNLENAIRTGLFVSGAKGIVDKMTDDQVASLCMSGRPPLIVKALKGEKIGWNRGKNGGVVRFDGKNNTAEGIISATGLETPPEGAVEKREKEVRQLIR